MEFLTALACALPCLLIPVLGFAIWLGLRQGKDNQRAAAEQTTVLEQLGLLPAGTPPWRVGTVAGRAVAVKAQRTGKVTHGLEASGVTLGIKLVALFPLDVPLDMQLFRNTTASAATTFERLYYVLGGGLPADLPPRLTEGLLAWALEVPGDSVEVGPRASTHLYAGEMHPEATSLVRVEGAARDAPEEVRAWLEACVARIDAMER